MACPQCGAATQDRCVAEPWHQCFLELAQPFIAALVDEMDVAGPSPHDCDYLLGWEAAVEWLRVRSKER